MGALELSKGITPLPLILSPTKSASQRAQGSARIRKFHETWAGAQTGGFQEWYGRKEFFIDHSCNRISLFNDGALFGFFSARIRADTSGIVKLSHHRGFRPCSIPSAVLYALFSSEKY